MAYTEQIKAEEVQKGDRIIFNNKWAYVWDTRQSILSVSLLVSPEGRGSSFWLKYSNDDMVTKKVKA